MGGVYHLLAATGIVLGISWNHWLAIPSFFAVGFFWEKTQHRYYWSLEEGPAGPRLHREKQGWFGWITKHRLWEAAGWGLGGTLAAGILEIIGRMS